jgi:Cu/Ag efflux pump CusA
VIRALVGWSVHYRLLVIGAMAAVLLFGTTQAGRVPVDLLPEFTPPYVEIQTEALGLSADEVEQLITVPMEADLLHGVAFLDSIESQSVAGLSSIVLTFNPGTDIFQARQVVTERLTQAHALPNVSKPPTMLQPLSSASRVQMVALSSSDVSLVDLSVLARWTIRPRLMSVPGVANVAIWGQRERQLQVLVDPARLQAQRISLAHVIETAGNAMWVSPLTYLDASTPGTGGFIDTPNQRLGVQHLLPIHSAEDLAKVPIAPEDTGGRLILLGDVADIVEDHQPLIGNAIVGTEPGLLLVVEKFPEANTLEVTRGIEEALDALRPGLGGVTIDTQVYRPATYLEEALGNLGLAILVGGVLLAALLAALLFDPRRAIVAIVAVGASLAAAAVLLTILGATFNAILVAGLITAVAVVVDEAVAGSAPVPRAAAELSRAERVRAAALDGRGALIFATVIAVIAIVPAWFVGGAAGTFLPSLAAAYVAAVVVAAIVALTVTPALRSLIGPADATPGRASPMMARLQGAYARALKRALGRRRPLIGLALAATLVSGVGAAVGASTAPEALLPTFREPDLLVRWAAVPGTSNEEMTRIVARASAELRAVPGISDVGSHVGRAITSDQVVGVNSAELWVTLAPGAAYDAAAAAVEEIAGGYPGVDASVTTYQRARVDDVVPTPPGDVVVRVYGNDQSSLEAKAEEVRAALAGIAGVTSATVERPAMEPTVEIEVDLAAAEQHGIKAGDVRRASTTLLSGIQVGSLFEAQKVFEVVVWGTPETRHSLSSIRDLLVQAPGGTWVRLGDIARVDVAAAPAVVHREGVFRVLDVTAVVSGRDVGAVTSDAQARLQQIPFPIESHAEVIPLALDRQGALGTLVAVIGATLVAVFLLLQAATSSWRRAALLFLVVPAGLIGGLLGAVVAGGEASLGVVGGFVALLAVGFRQALRLIDQLDRAEGASDGNAADANAANSDPRGDAVVSGSLGRLGDVLTTGATTIAAFLPIAFLGGEAGLEVLRPLAAVVIGGLLTTSLVTLFVVPAIARATPRPDHAEIDDLAHALNREPA